MNKGIKGFRRAGWLVAGAAMLAVAAYLLFPTVRRARRERIRPLEAVPADAFLVATVDLDALRGSPLGASLLGPRADRVIGGRNVTELCGFDPLARTSELALAVPETGEPGEFAVVVRADLSREELLGCAQKVLSRGAEQGPGATTSQRGSYTLFTLVAGDSGVPRPAPTLAYREGGPFIVGQGAWLDAVLDAVEGRGTRATAAGDHASLRRELGELGEASLPLVVDVTVRLPASVRERVRASMADSLDQADPRQARIMDGVLGVATAGVAVRAGAAGGAAEVAAVAHCEKTPDCAEVETLLGKKRLDWSKQFSVRLLGLGALLDSMTIDRHDAMLKVSARAASNEVAGAVERLLRGVGSPTPPQRTPPADEVVTAPRDAGGP